MAQFSQLIITKSGQELLSKILLDGGKLEFTKVCISDAEIALESLETLTEIPSVKQESAVGEVTVTGSSAVKVEVSFSNMSLSEGYFMRALGLYANDNGRSVLYAAAVEQSGHCYMPPYNGVTVSGAALQLVTSVGNAENVSLEVDPAGTATIQRLSEEISKHNNDENAHAELFAAMAQKPTAFSVDVSSWSELGTEFAGCTYSAEIMDEGVSAADFPDIYFDGNSLEAAMNAAVISAAEDGKIVLYAADIPEQPLAGAYFIKKGALQ